MSAKPNRKAGRPKVIKDDWVETIAIAMIEWFKEDGNLWLKDYAHTVESPTKKMPYSWTGLLSACENNKVFSEALKICHEMQESKLFKIGLTTKSPMPVFALKNVAGWRDRPTEEQDDDFLPSSVRLEGE